MRASAIANIVASVLLAVACGANNTQDDTTNTPADASVVPDSTSKTISSVNNSSPAFDKPTETLHQPDQPIETTSGHFTDIPDEAQAEAQSGIHPVEANSSPLLNLQHDDQLKITVENLAAAYQTISGAWNDFDPGDYPAIVIFRSDGNITHLLAINHSNTDRLGQATALDNDGLPFDSLHRIDDVADEVNQKIKNLTTYAFQIMLGDIYSFAMAAETSGYFDPAKPNWTSTYLHEMFHLYQFAEFQGSRGLQDWETYDYTAANLELAVLEERALHEALTTPSDEARTTAARHFAAIRLARMEVDDRVRLDNDQERLEGTARYIEHRLGSENRSYPHHDANYEQDLQTDFSVSRVKEAFGFGRFYASGAAVVRVLDLLGAQNSDRKIQRGDSPAEVLIKHLGVTQNDVSLLLDEARKVYDPSGDLNAEAAKAAAQALSELTVFEDEPIGGGGNPESFEGSDDFDYNSSGSTDRGPISITEEQYQCLEEAGFGDDAPVPTEIFDSCLAT